MEYLYSVIIKLGQALTQIYKSNKFPFIIICVGIGLRLVRYLHNTPLWFDEAVYAVDIINRSLTEFIHPSSYYTQTSPLNFLIFSKLAVQTFGNSEYALRLVPLVFGIASLLLFYKVAKDILSPKAVPVALTLFAVLDPLIYYSAELKSYSGDIAFTLLILAVTPYLTKKLNMQSLFLFALAGADAISFSNPSVLVLAGVGIGLLLSCVKIKNWARLRSFLIVFIIWGLSFIVIYLVYTRTMSADLAKNIGIEKAFKMEQFIFPFPPRSLMDVKWFIDFFFDTFLFQVPTIYIKNVTLSGLMAFTFLVGSVAMFNEKREKFYVLIFPVLFALLATALHLFPFKGRHILFLIPMFLLIISEGTEYIRDRISKNSAMMGAILIGLLLIYPVSWAAYHVKKPLIRSEIRPVLNYIQSNWQEGDIIYVHFFAQYELEYYSKYHPDPFDFKNNQYIIGIGPRGWYKLWSKNNVPERYKDLEDQSKDDLKKEYINDMNQLIGRKRVWVLFGGDVTSEGIFISHLDSIGQKRDSFGHSGLGLVYLYDLSNQVQSSSDSDKL